MDVAGAAVCPSNARSQHICADGVFQLLLDNNNAGRGGHRQPTGYFRLHTNAATTSLPLHVTLRQVIYHGVLEANVTDHSGASVCSFTAFVNAADTDKPVAVIDIAAGSATPTLEWVASSHGNPAYGWANGSTSAGGAQTLFVSVLAGKSTASDATAAA
eukprot:COSAG04_NODE_10491_length_773_cov_0.918398_1_plen_158_part_10